MRNLKKKGGGKTPAQQDDIGENSENFKTLQMNIEAAKTKKYDALLIGSSTGGPVAVEKILKDLGKDFPLPVLITQHIDAQFDRQFAKWLTESSGFSTELAEDGVFIEPGHAYIAPANHHLSVQYLGGKYSIHLNDDPPLHFLKPSVDKMFSTCSQVFKGKLIAAILTGMGRDGADGIKDIASKGGETIAQDEDTCVVFGMPKSAIETGAIKEVLPLEDIGNYIRLIAR